MFMEHAEMQSAGRELTPPREIGEDELGNLISAVGNHEAKAITLITMQPGRIYTESDLWRRLIDVQGESIGWRMSKRLPFNYCSYTFSSIGLVAREVVNPDLSTYGYEITPYGIEVGVPLVGHLLDLSLRYDKSLIQIFGQTSSPAKTQETIVEKEAIEFKKRAPIARFKIFWELLTSSLPTQEKDLANALGAERRYVSNHIQELARFGIINLKSSEADKASSFYHLSEERPDEKPQAYHQLILTQQIYQFFLNNPGISGSPDELGKKFMAEINRSVSLGTFSGILSHLAKQGYLKHEGFTRYIQSEIDLTEEQKIMLCELLEIIDNFQRGDREFLEEGRRKAQKILANPQTVAKLLLKAKESSQRTGATQKAELEDQLFELLLRYPGSNTTRLQQLLQENYDKELTRDTIAAFLKKEKRFIPQARRNSIYWIINAD